MHEVTTMHRNGGVPLDQAFSRHGTRREVAYERAEQSCRSLVYTTDHAFQAIPRLLAKWRHSPELNREESSHAANSHHGGAGRRNGPGGLPPAQTLFLSGRRG